MGTSVAATMGRMWCYFSLQERRRKCNCGCLEPSPLSARRCSPTPAQSKPTTKVDAQWSILAEPGLAECLAQFPLRPTGLVTDHSNGSLRPTGLVADQTMTHEQTQNECFP